MQTEPTRIQPAHGKALVPASELRPAETEAHERSPTLMAGELAGMQGQVRIWSPNRRLLRGMAVCIGVCMLLLLAAMIAVPYESIWIYLLGCLVAIFLFCICACVAALRRPCYITTDSAGIGITTRRGSQALRWSEIRTAETADSNDADWSAGDGIALRAPHHVYINLLGYSETSRKRLFALIITQSALQEHPAKRRLFVNPDLPLPVPAVLMAEGSEDIRSEVIAGRKTEAIKRYRKRHGGTYSKAAEAVESLESNIQFHSPETILSQCLPDPQLRRELENLVRQGHQWQARKRYRRRTGADPVQANDVISLLEAAPALAAGPNPMERKPYR